MRPELLRRLGNLMGERNRGRDTLARLGGIVRDVASDDASRVTVRSIHEISKVMGKQTVAEWVENDSTLDLLRETGVDFVQGYHLGRPEPMAEVLGRTEA